MISIQIFYLKWVKHLKFELKLQTPYYHPIHEWLLGETSGNQGKPMMDH